MTTEKKVHSKPILNVCFDQTCDNPTEGWYCPECQAAIELNHALENGSYEKFKERSRQAENRVSLLKASRNNRKKSMPGYFV